MANLKKAFAIIIGFIIDLIIAIFIILYGSTNISNNPFLAYTDAVMLGIFAMWTLYFSIYSAEQIWKRLSD